MPTRFMHTSDWQLGVTRHFMNDDAQARWSEARFEGVRNLSTVAKAEECEFIVVAGDIFESNQVDRKTVVKACEAMSTVAIPIYLLPGNHDPLDAGSVFSSKTWQERKPAHVHVLDSAGSRHVVRSGVEVVGAPWTSKRPLTDLVAGVATGLEPQAGVLRVMVGHGAVDKLSPDRDNPAVIRRSEAERAIQEGRYHYLALGDRHSLTSIGDSDRIFYSGTHEAYDFDEVDPGKTLIVDLDIDSVSTKTLQNGRWRFLVHSADVSNTADVDALARYLDSIPDKARTVLKLGLVGTLSIPSYAHLENVEANARDLFAAVVRSSSRSELSIMPESTDFDGLNLAGFASSTVEKLRKLASGTGPEQRQAADALALLLRLIGRTV